MLKVFPIGGIEGVTKNMFVYEHNDDMIIVDCGIGFPDETMPGVEFLIPDTQYIQKRLDQGATLHGIVLTHGHDDHIAALAFAVRELELDPSIPIYGSPLTAEFAMTRMADNGVEREVQYLGDEPINLGPFTIDPVWVTHSIPDTRHLAIHTPEGVIYHGSDFKFDLTPIDGKPSDYQKIAHIGREGVLCALIDCLRIERSQPARSESSITTALRHEMHGVDGRIFVTLMSSSIHRIQQVINVAAEHGRKVTFIGRSVEQNVNTALNLGLLNFPPETKLNKRNIDSIPDNELCVVIAGSQGQPRSSFVRAVFGEHRFVNITKGDKVIFSSDAIPGSERYVNRAINELANQGIEVIYSDINDDLHVSGHASEYEQMTLLHLLQPKYVFPVGGEPRHRTLFGLKVQEHGYKPSQVVLPMEGKWVEFSGGSMRYSDEQVKLRERTVDGSGVANIIAEHLDERTSLGKNGVLVISLVDRNGRTTIEDMWIETRGVGLGDEVTFQQFVTGVKEMVADLLPEVQDKPAAQMRDELEGAITRMLTEELGNSPHVVVVIN